MNSRCLSAPRFATLPALLLLLAAPAPAEVSRQAAERSSLPQRDMHASASTFSHHEEEISKARIKFSNPAQPGTLNLRLPWATVNIYGSASLDEVVVSTDLEETGKPRIRPDGLRRLDEEVSFALTEKDNVITLRLSGDEAKPGPDTCFEIWVPRNTAIIYRTEQGGDLVAEDVSGEIDISCTNGDITLLNPAGAAVVNTLNGDIRADFKAAPVKPVSFSSKNGEILLTLPAATKANLRLRTRNGSLLTDFPDTALLTRSESRPAQSSDTNREIALAAREAAQAGREAAVAAGKALRVAAKEFKEAFQDEEENEDQEEAAPAPPPVPAPASALEQPAPAAPAAPPSTPAPAAAPKAPRPPVASGFRYSGGKSIVGTLNGGGVAISLDTMNGDITVRQGK